MKRIMTIEELDLNFNSFTYNELSQGWIELDPPWESRQLTTVELGFVIRPRRMHKKIVDAVCKAIHVITRNAMFDHEFEYIEDIQFWAPRHIANDKRRRLSSHTWGVAFDVNAWENMPGCKNHKIPDKIVEIFENVGFYWGGRFSSNDWMHFEPSSDFFEYKEKW